MAFLPPVGDLSPAHARTFTDFSSDIDLSAQVGCPAHPAQRLEIYHAETTGQALVVTGYDGVDFTVTAGPSVVRVVDAAVTRVVSSGTGDVASVVAYWWSSGSSRINQAP
jgi:hypothetical protein